MEELTITLAAIGILIVYTLDFKWLVEKAFNLIGGCNND
jgi:hypothetical protein